LVLHSSLVLGQNYSGETYKISECYYADTSTYRCGEKDVNYFIRINTDNSFFVVVDRELNNIVHSLDIIGYYQISDNIWYYDLSSEKNKRYSLTFDLNKQNIILFPIISLYDDWIPKSILFKIKKSLKT
jgi:hypothetical protein